MPIKPENVGRYPKNWKAIRERILERAGNNCEGSPKFPDCRIPNGWFRNNETGQETDDLMAVETWTVVDGISVTRIVLTIGYLDHQPENCAEDNLRAWCQRCHLNYDAKHHAESSYATRRAGRALSDFFPAKGNGARG